MTSCDVCFLCVFKPMSVSVFLCVQTHVCSFTEILTSFIYDERMLLTTNSFSEYTHHWPTELFVGCLGFLTVWWAVVLLVWSLSLSPLAAVLGVPVGLLGCCSLLDSVRLCLLCRFLVLLTVCWVVCWCSSVCVWHCLLAVHLSVWAIHCCSCLSTLHAVFVPFLFAYLVVCF